MATAGWDFVSEPFRGYCSALGLGTLYRSGASGRGGRACVGHGFDRRAQTSPVVRRNPSCCRDPHARRESGRCEAPFGQQFCTIRRKSTISYCTGDNRLRPFNISVRLGRAFSSPQTERLALQLCPDVAITFVGPGDIERTGNEIMIGLDCSHSQRPLTICGLMPHGPARYAFNWKVLVLDNPSGRGLLHRTDQPPKLCRKKSNGSVTVRDRASMIVQCKMIDWRTEPTVGRHAHPTRMAWSSAAPPGWP